MRTKITSKHLTDKWFGKKYLFLSRGKIYNSLLAFHHQEEIYCDSHLSIICSYFARCRYLSLGSLFIKPATRDPPNTRCRSPCSPPTSRNKGTPRFHILHDVFPCLQLNPCPHAMSFCVVKIHTASISALQISTRGAGVELSPKPVHVPAQF